MVFLDIKVTSDTSVVVPDLLKLIAQMFIMASKQIIA